MENLIAAELEALADTCRTEIAGLKRQPEQGEPTVRDEIRFYERQLRAFEKALGYWLRGVRPVQTPSGMGIYNIINKCAAQAGLEEVHPHDFRRTYISDLFDKGVDVSTISKLAGHNEANHTVGYDRRKEDPKRRAAELYDEEE